MHCFKACVYLCLLLAYASASEYVDELSGLKPLRRPNRSLTGERPPVAFESEWVVRVEDGASVRDLESHGYEVMERVADLDNIFLVRHTATHARHQSSRDLSFVASTEVTQSLLAHPAVQWAEQQFKDKPVPRATFSDPTYKDQWHLKNTGQFGPSGIDVNIQEAWDSGFNGQGVRVAVVDDGFQSAHPDLSPRFAADSSYSYNAPIGPDPSPNVAIDFHGTAAAGVAVAAANGVCGVGAAYQAEAAGIRLISSGTTDATKATGLSYKNQLNDIYSNSWGPDDGGIDVNGRGPATTAAIQNSVATGRGGLGNIYVWAAGNGAENNDNCNYDGYSNAREVIAVGALGADGKKSFYSEPCAALIVVAPSNSAVANAGIRTSDLVGGNGYSADSCADSFGGTSSACPLVAGIVALVLQANPNLSWRDVQLVLAKSGTKIDSSDADWTTNGAGFHVNHKYGFGLIDASRAVRAAKAQVPLSEAIVASSAVVNVGQAISDFPSPGASTSVEITQNVLVERVTITVVINHQASGDLQIEVTSPKGTKSVLSAPHATTPALFVGTTGIVVGPAEYGPPISFTPATGTIVASTPADGCTAPTNCAALNGAMAYVVRGGTCAFTVKTKNVQNCGATGMILANNVVNDAGTIYTIPGTDATITIPSVFLSYTDAQAAAAPGKAGRIVTSKYNTNSYATGWAFTTTRSMGEPSAGTWTVTATDLLPGTAGTFTSVQIKVDGVATKSDTAFGFNFSSSASSTTFCASFVLALIAALALAM